MLVLRHNPSDFFLSDADRLPLVATIPPKLSAPRPPPASASASASPELSYQDPYRYAHRGSFDASAPAPPDMHPPDRDDAPSQFDGGPSWLAHPSEPSSSLLDDPSSSGPDHPPPPLSPPDASSRYTRAPGSLPEHARYSYPPPASGSVSRHMSDPNLHAASHPFPASYPVSAHVDPRRFQQQQQQQQQHSHFAYPHAGSLLHSPSRPLSFSSIADQRPDTAGSTASSVWDPPSDAVHPFQTSLSGPPHDDPTSPLHSAFSGSSTSSAHAPGRGVHSSPAFQYLPPHHAFDDEGPADARPGSSGYISGEQLHYSRPPHGYPRATSPRPSSSGSLLARTSPAIRSTHPKDTSDDSGTGALSDPQSSKTYSFVSLPGNAVKKRPRRRYDEIERLYHCSWPGCTKSYGTLNHLNAHIVMQRHGTKRSPGEFKELRKQWRKAKKEESERAALAQQQREQHHHHQQHQHHPHQHPQDDPYGLPTHSSHLGTAHQQDPRFLPSYVRPHAYNAQQPVGMGIPLSLAGPGVERYPLGMDDMPGSSAGMGMRYLPPHQQQQQQQQQQMLYEHRERTGSAHQLYPVPQGVGQGHVQGQGQGMQIPPMNVGWNVLSEQEQPRGGYDYPPPARQEPWANSLDYERRQQQQQQQQHRLSSRPIHPYALSSPSSPPPHSSQVQQTHGHGHTHGQAQGQGHGQGSVQHQQHQGIQRTNTLPPDSTLLTALPGYEPPLPPADSFEDDRGVVGEGGAEEQKFWVN